MTPKAISEQRDFAVRSLRSLRSHYAVTTVTTRSLRSLRGYYAVGHYEVINDSKSGLASTSQSLRSLRGHKCLKSGLAITSQSLRGCVAVTSRLQRGRFAVTTRYYAVTTGEVPCGAHVFEGFFGLENGPVKSDKSQEKTLFGKDFPKPAKTQL